jgi:hypothetical protein
MLGAVISFFAFFALNHLHELVTVQFSARGLQAISRPAVSLSYLFLFGGKNKSLAPKCWQP